MPSHGKIAKNLGMASLLVAAASCHGGGPPAAAPGRADAGASTPLAVGVPATDPGALGPGAGAQVALAVPDAPPLGLTASDGSGLRLAQLDASVVVDGPLAFTELRLAFENPEARTLEGTFRIALPQGASIGRFAMKIGGEWQEGEVVEKEAARVAYEDFLHRKQDPALMEKASGNEFSARVFPIPARGTKELVVSYVHEIPDGAYLLPLKGLPELGSLRARVHVVGAPKDPPALALDRTRPTSDLVVDAKTYDPASFASAPLAAVRSGELAIVRVRPQSEKRPEALSSVVVLVDTSASRALGFEDEIELVGRLATKVAGEGGSLTVAAFDQTVAPVYDGPAKGFGAADLDRLRARGALGASDLAKALGWAGEQAKRAGKKRVVLVSDGVATAGPSDTGKLGAAAATLRGAGVERIDALAVGGIRDDAALTRVVRGNVPHDGVVLEVTPATRDRALARLAEATRSGVQVAVEGATWSWPSKLDGVQAGDAFTVYAEVPAGKPLRVALDGGAAKEAQVRPTERPLVERAVAQAKVNGLLEQASAPQKAGAAADLAKTITRLGVKHRIVTPYTSMLVLETEADYARFAIDRRSLADLLVVDGGTVRKVARNFLAGPPSLPNPPKPPGRAPVPRQVEEDDDPLDPSTTMFARGERPPARPAPTPAPRTAPRAEAKSEQAEAPSEKREAYAAKPSAQVATARRASPSGASAPPPASPSRTRRPSGGAAAPEPEEALAVSRVRPGPVRMDRAQDEGVGPAGELGSGTSPYDGRFAVVMRALAEGSLSGADDALREARAWHAEQPGDVLALVALGEAAEARSATELAARAYGSLVDLFPNRADLRRFAGERLDRVAAKDVTALELAIDTYTKAVLDRPDHPAGHRLLAYAQLRAKEPAKAFATIEAALRRGYEASRFEGSDRILAEDVGLIGAAWAAAEPARRGEILARVRAVGGRVEDGPSLRFVLVWETDANDVDFHITDARGGHAFFSQMHLPSGGDLYADVTTGYGPECFTIRAPRARRAAPYRLYAHYYSRGPMGYGMGKLQVVEHDGKGGLTFEDRPFLVMADGAYVDLGTVK